MFHSLVYSYKIFNVLPVKGLYMHWHVGTIATTWCLNRDSLALCPAVSTLPDVTATLEDTGAVADSEDDLPNLTQTGVEEGDLHDDDEDDLPPLYPPQATPNNNETQDLHKEEDLPPL
jgi:hypothetical protein